MTKEFTSLVEHTVDAFTENDDSAVEDVRRILHDLRKQYDDIHSEAEQKELELGRLRETVRAAESQQGLSVEEIHGLEATRAKLKQKCEESTQKIQEALTNKKVYENLLERTKKEQAALREKMNHMEQYLWKKNIEREHKLAACRRMHQEKVEQVLELENMEMDVEFERASRDTAVSSMGTTLQTKRNAIKRRADFERWRHEVALEAANEAFQASAGRLRKIYAVEKLAGNCLQKIIFEQVEKSQAMEDGFQTSREVTGLTDVMDIVHKFLNRDVEHEQLKNAVKEAEEKLQGLREVFERFKNRSDGLTYDPETAGRSRGIYMQVEDQEALLGKNMKESEETRQRLMTSTVLIEHMKRWANRVSKSMSAFEEPVLVDKPHDIVPFFQSLLRTTDKFLGHIQMQLQTGKVQRKTVFQAASKEYHEQARLLNDKEFLRCNCRIPATADGGRPQSGQRHERDNKKGEGEDEGGPGAALAVDRDKMKQESYSKVSEEEKRLQERKAGESRN
jgi:hypothetical protein